MLSVKICLPLFTQVSCDCCAVQVVWETRAQASEDVYHHEQVQERTFKGEQAGKVVSVVHQHSERGRCSSFCSRRVVGVDECVGLQGIHRCRHKLLLPADCLPH